MAGASRNRWHAGFVSLDKPYREVRIWLFTCTSVSGSGVTGQENPDFASTTGPSNAPCTLSNPKLWMRFLSPSSAHLNWCPRPTCCHKQNVDVLFAIITFYITSSPQPDCLWQAGSSGYHSILYYIILEICPHSVPTLLPTHPSEVCPYSVSVPCYTTLY